MPGFDLHGPEVGVGLVESGPDARLAGGAARPGTPPPSVSDCQSAHKEEEPKIAGENSSGQKREDGFIVGRMRKVPKEKREKSAEVSFGASC